MSEEKRQELNLAATVGLDVPLKALVWEDTAGKTWISYNEPHWIAERHGITDAQPAIIEDEKSVLLA